MGMRMKRLFIVFAYLTLLLVVAAFASIVANTFMATYTESGAIDYAASSANASTAMISVLFILIAIIFGYLSNRRHMSLGISTLIGVVLIVAIVAIGLNWHPFYLSNSTWMIILGLYICAASVVPVWILLQPRDYLSSFLLYFMIIVAVIGIIGAHPTVEIPAFTGFVDTIAPTGTSLGYLFPALFVTIACGAISGFHSLVSSGTTAKQLDHEAQARPIGYGSMMIECVLAIISVIAVGYVWASYSSGETVVPTAVFASGISKMVAVIPGLAGLETVCYTMLVLAVSVFCLTSLDTATRLARYMFQEFWLNEGETVKDTTGYKKVLTNPYVATIITVVLGIGLGMTGYAKIWPLFGAANQLLAALGLLAVATWLGKISKNNRMFFIPMIFMLIVTITSLCFTIKSKIALLASGGPEAGWSAALLILSAVLILLAVVLAVEGIKTLIEQSRAKKQAAAQ